MARVANVGQTEDAARVELVVPSLELLPDYLDAVRRGWMGDRVLFGSSEELLALAEQDPQLVLDRLRDRSTDGVLYYRDGSAGPRVPALFRWVWDGGFAGNIDLRWQPGETAGCPMTSLGMWGTRRWSGSEVAGMRPGRCRCCLPLPRLRG